MNFLRRVVLTIVVVISSLDHWSKNTAKRLFNGDDVVSAECSDAIAALLFRSINSVVCVFENLLRNFRLADTKILGLAVTRPRLESP